MVTKSFTTIFIVSFVFLFCEFVESYSKEEALARFATSTPLRIVQCSLNSSSSGGPFHHGGSLAITLRSDLSPNAAFAFEQHVRNGYYDGCYIFRVLKGFVAQFGFQPRKQSSTRITRPMPDLVTEHSLRNERGTLAFAGASAVQVYVNLGNNKRLDSDGLPFAQLSQDSMAMLDKLDTSHKDGDGQIAAIKAGDNVVVTKFPRMTKIDSCIVL